MLHVQVKRSPRVEVNATEGLRLTTEVKSDDLDGKGSDDGSGSNSSSNGSRRSSKRMSRKKGSFDPSALEKAAAAAGSPPGGGGGGGQLSPDKAGKAGCSVM